LAKLPQNDGRRFSSVSNSITHGKRSEHFQNFLERYGCTLKDVDTFDPNFSTKFQLKLDLLNEFDQRIKGALLFYKSTGARGLSMLDELVHLRGQILEREKKLVQEGKDPLTDQALQRANSRLFEIVKFLEHIKYDQEKTERIHELKKEENRDDDIIFVREK
jgi:hypothetical protein